MRILKLLIPAFAAAVTPAVMANGQNVLADQDQAIAEYFWPTLYAQGGTSLYCNVPFDGPSEHISAAPVYSIKQIKTALGCMTDTQCAVKTPSYAFMAADLHNLYPVDSSIEQKRRQAPFGSLKDSARTPNDLGCSARATFHMIEPADHAKGNIARAYFYMQHSYRLPLGADLDVLKQWHALDPVDDSERARNEAIAKIQGTRNPFIDEPELVQSLSAQ